MTLRRSRSDGDRLVGSPTAAVLFGMVILVTHGFGSSLTPALLPRIADSFQAGYGVLGLAVATGIFAYGLGAVLGIRVVERIPPRGLLIVCLAVCGTGFLAVSSAGSPRVLAMCVVVIGLASPISWSVSVYIVGRMVRPGSHGRVMAIAAAGVALGNGINGVFVQLLVEPDQWRVAFVIAAALSACMVAGTLLVFRLPIDAPSRAVTIEHEENVWRRIWSVPAGRVVILSSTLAGVGGFTFTTYLSEVAVDELLVGPVAAAVPWWLASVVGVTIALPVGLIADRGSPVGVMSMMVFTYAAALTFLVFRWSYPALLVAAFGFAVFNFPVWGLLGLAAHRSLPPELAVRAVSGGLAAAAPAAVLGITGAGMWIDRSGSFRAPLVVLAVLMILATIWLRVERYGESRRGIDRP